ncbi:hypothetical protein AC1031_005244 [Aphanomyces cochlioides]|nr:hypothetical protein AC1031_005244 [Aphanomyces cochlioides]
MVGSTPVQFELFAMSVMSRSFSLIVLTPDNTEQQQDEPSIRGSTMSVPKTSTPSPLPLLRSPSTVPPASIVTSPPTSWTSMTEIPPNEAVCRPRIFTAFAVTLVLFAIFIVASTLHRTKQV